MHKKRDRGDPSKEHLNDCSTDVRLRNWQGARVFLDVVRCGSFRAAAQVLNVSANTLRREIEEFEHEIGITLLTRHVDGVRLTAEGEIIVSTTKRMESAAHDIARVRNLSVAVEGEVRLGITEGLGTFWIAPRLVEFRRAYPGLLINMHCAMHPSDVLRLETDVGIQITPPTAKDLRIVKIGRMHVMPFAAPSYLEMYGTPKTLAEFTRHQLVIQVSDQIAAQEVYEKLFPQMPQVGHVAFKSNVSSAHYSLIARGSGIGALPTYAGVMSKKIVPIDIPGLHISQDIWLVYHRDAARLPRVRRLIDWVIAAFSPKQYPWFADEFIHPRDLPGKVGNTAISDMIESFEDFLP